MKNKSLFKRKIFGFMDMLSTKKMVENRMPNVEKTKNQDIKTKFHVNDLADKLHPGSHLAKIISIEKINKDVKTFRFQPIDNHAVYFRAGQYISISVNINGTIIGRPYSLSGSPKEAKSKNYYEITIKRKPDGLISNYMLNKAKVGDKMTISEPLGDFHYSEIRDPKHIIAIAGGSGITPFISMAKAIIEGDEDFNLTILYGSRTKKDIIFYNELIDLEKKSKGKIKVVFVLSNEKVNGFEEGYINATLIKKYMQDKSSIWMCGPKGMYKFILKEIMPLRLSKKYIRIEASNDIGKPEMYPEYKNTGKKSIYNIKVNIKGKEYNITGRSDETLIVALQKAKISIQSKCLSGQCSWCSVKLVSGTVFSPKDFASNRKADKKNNVVYTCSVFPTSDLVIDAL